MSAHILGLDEDLVLFFDFPVHVWQSCSNNTWREKRIIKDKYYKHCVFWDQIVCNNKMILSRFTSKDMLTKLCIFQKAKHSKCPMVRIQLNILWEQPYNEMLCSIVEYGKKNSVSALKDLHHSLSQPGQTWFIQNDSSFKREWNC